ncbi:MAG: sigma-70 family RNA polymerase sigma factor [Patescibacteria group bacterium]
MKRKLRYIKLYFKFKDKIYSYFWYRTGGKAEIAEDLTQEVFLKAWKEFSNYSQDKPFQAWIYKIAHNHLVDYYRASRPEVDIEKAKKHCGEKDVYPELWLMLDQLPEKEKNILVLKYLHGFNYREIGEMIAQSEGSVRVSAYRALKKLKIKNYEK